MLSGLNEAVMKEAKMSKVEEAAKALAEAMRANIAAGYEVMEAQARRGWLEGAFWNEEGFRRQARLDMAVANQNATHLACIEALAAYDMAAQMDRLMAGARAACAASDGVESGYADLMSKIGAAVRSCKDLVEHTEPNDSAVEP